MTARILSGPPGMKGRAMTRCESAPRRTGRRTTPIFDSVNGRPDLPALLSGVRRVARLRVGGSFLLVLVRRVLLFGLVLGFRRLVAHENAPLSSFRFASSGGR